MTEALLADLEHRPEREVIDQHPSRLWHPNGSRILIARQHGGAMARALIQYEPS